MPLWTFSKNKKRYLYGFLVNIKKKTLWIFSKNKQKYLYGFPLKILKIPLLIFSKNKKKIDLILTKLVSNEARKKI